MPIISYTYFTVTTNNETYQWNYAAFISIEIHRLLFCKSRLISIDTCTHYRAIQKSMSHVLVIKPNPCSDTTTTTTNITQVFSPLYMHRCALQRSITSLISEKQQIYTGCHSGKTLNPQDNCLGVLKLLSILIHSKTCTGIFLYEADTWILT